MRVIAAIILILDIHLLLYSLYQRQAKLWAIIKSLLYAAAQSIQVYIHYQMLDNERLFYGAMFYMLRAIAFFSLLLTITIMLVLLINREKQPYKTAKWTLIAYTILVFTTCLLDAIFGSPRTALTMLCFAILGHIPLMHYFVPILFKHVARRYRWLYITMTATAIGIPFAYLLMAADDGASRNDFYTLSLLLLPYVLITATNLMEWLRHRREAAQDTANH